MLAVAITGPLNSLGVALNFFFFDFFDSVRFFGVLTVNSASLSHFVTHWSYFRNFIGQEMRFPKMRFLEKYFGYKRLFGGSFSSFDCTKICASCIVFCCLIIIILCCRKCSFITNLLFMSTPKIMCIMRF